MNTTAKKQEIDMKVFLENRHNFPPEELMQYAGQYIAWNMEGTGIIANAADLEEMYRQVEAAGFDPSQVVGSYLDPL